MTHPPKLQLSQVIKSYGDKRILDEINLTVAPGEFCTLVGPSGCGKSTLLRMILGQEFPDSGSLQLDGQPAHFPDPSRGIVFQRYSLFPHLTVLDNLLLGHRLSHQNWWLPWRANSAATDKAMDFLRRVRMEHAANKYPHELSGGMQQRAAIAQSLLMKPPVLLMDEPFGALDPDTREELQIFILELWQQEQLTIFFVTHDLEESLYLGSRLLVLSQYYSDDRIHATANQKGAKIVADHAIDFGSLSTSVKDSREFKELIHSVRQEGFNPRVMQHVNEFNLLHPDAFHYPAA